MKHLTLSVEPRTTTGKSVRHLRRDGLVPAVVYGGTLDAAQSVQINQRELERVLLHAGSSTVIDLQTGDGSLPVLARSVQRHPLRHTLMHVDFLAIRMDRTIAVEVPVHLVGHSEIVEEKAALLMHLADVVEVEALPDNLPSSLEVDISSLKEIGDQLLAGDLTLPEGVTLVSNGDLLVASLIAPSLTLEEEDEMAAEEEAAEGEEEIEADDSEEESADKASSEDE